MFNISVLYPPASPVGQERVDRSGGSTPSENRRTPVVESGVQTRGTSRYYKTWLSKLTSAVSHSVLTYLQFQPAVRGTFELVVFGRLTLLKGQ
jgi:hypothetical protein